MSKLFKMNLFKYEMRNIIGNPFNLGFGLIFPIVMFTLISFGIKGSLSGIELQSALTSIFVSYLFTASLAISFIGFSSLLSLELESRATLRLSLFGYSDVSIMYAKIAANIVVAMTASLLYAVVTMPIHGIALPGIDVILFILVCVFIMSVLFLMISYSIAVYFKKFGPAYAVSLITYFLVMFFMGSMGARVENFPRIVQTLISNNIPITRLIQDVPQYWGGLSNYNMMPFLQSLLIFSAVTICIITLCLKRQRRK